MRNTLRENLYLKTSKECKRLEDFGLCVRVVTKADANKRSGVFHVLQGTKQLESAVNLRISERRRSSWLKTPYC
jgi:hypothetical protein